MLAVGIDTSVPGLGFARLFWVGTRERGGGGLFGNRRKKREPPLKKGLIVRTK